MKNCPISLRTELRLLSIGVARNETIVTFTSCVLATPWHIASPRIRLPTGCIPAWRPDGGQIAFVRFHPSGTTSIYTISPLEGVEKKLIDRPGFTGKMSWNPDGSGLVFVSRMGSKSELVFLDVSSGETRTVLSSPISEGRHRFPAISPKGDKLAFAFCDAPTDAAPCDPYVVGISRDMKLLGDPQRISVNCPRVPTGIAWTPDGRTLVYGCSSSIQFDGRPWRISVSSGKSELLDVPPAALNPTIARLTGRLCTRAI